jgi:ribosome recycling factor
MADQEEIELVLMDAEERMAKSVEFFKNEAASLRTGRANPALLEHVTIELYGTNMTLNQVATITTPDPRLFVVQPFDRGTVGAIEKELLKADLGLTPNSDGAIIRLPVPAMTQERRLDMVKRLKRLLEEAHVAVRNVRRDSIDQLRTMEKNKEMSQDDLHRSQEQLQKITDEQVALANDASTRKEAELMEV